MKLRLQLGMVRDIAYQSIKWMTIVRKRFRNRDYRIRAAEPELIKRQLLRGTVLQKRPS